MNQPERAPRTGKRIELPGKRRHGTESGYASGCSCPACREAVATAVALRRAARAEKLRLGTVTVQHGTRNTYGNYDCRCAACTDANRQACAQYWRDRKPKKPTTTTTNTDKAAS